MEIKRDKTERERKKEYVLLLLFPVRAATLFRKKNTKRKNVKSHARASARIELIDVRIQEQWSVHVGIEKKKNAHTNTFLNSRFPFGNRDSLLFKPHLTIARESEKKIDDDDDDTFIIISFFR